MSEGNTHFSGEEQEQQEGHNKNNLGNSETDNLPVGDQSSSSDVMPKKEEGKEGEEEAEDYVAPPDGGWGWMVVFSSFLIHVIADGIVYSFGVFLIEFVEVFDAGRGAASWVGSLQPAVTFTVGPLSSALTNRYGCRTVTIMGAIISGIGFILSMFAPNLYFLYITAGVLAGLGFGLIYLPAIVCVAQYFEKRRSFATGLAVCGSGFGTFILAPITEFLVHKYSWRGSFLILGGVILNVIVCGIIFRPLEGQPGSKSPKSGSPETSESEEDKLALLSADAEKKAPHRPGELELQKVEGHGGDAQDQGQGEEAGKLRGEGEGLGRGVASLSNGKLANNVNENQPQKTKLNGNGTHPRVAAETDALVSSLTFEVSPPTDSPMTDFLTDTEPSSFQISTSQFLAPSNKKKNGGHDLALIAASEGALDRLTPQSAHIRKGDNKHGSRGGAVGGAGTRARRRQNSQGSPTLSPRPLARKDIFYSGSLLNIPMYKSNPDLYIAAVTPVASHHRSSMSSQHGDAPDGDDGDSKAGRASCACLALCSELRSTFHEMLSFSLLKNPVFLMFAISNFLTSIGFNMPFIFLPDRAILAGIDESQAAFLLSVIGIANTCGRVIFGFLSDRPWVNRLFLYNSALTICGLATAFSPAIGGSYTLFVVYAAVFGLFIGVYVSLTSVVLVDLLGLEYLTNSFGLLLLFQGAATFIGPPIAGWIYDGTGSYDISFILMGSMIAMSGAMLFFLPLVERRYNRRLSKAVIKHDADLGKQTVDQAADSSDSSSSEGNKV